MVVNTPPKTAQEYRAEANNRGITRNTPSKMALLALTIVIACQCAACTFLTRRDFPPPERAYIESKPESLDFYADDLDWETLSVALRQSLDYYKRASSFSYTIDGVTYRAEDMRESLLAFAKISAAELPQEEKQRLILQNFRIYRAAGYDGKGTVIFTGYHAPTLEGSLRKSERYRYPLYAPPPELSAESRRNPSRSDIDIKGVLKGRGLEIAWVDDPVALFFLHIQGSGTIVLENGKRVLATFAGTNGRKFHSIAQEMARRKLIPNMSNAAVKKYLYDNPPEAGGIMSYNERYTFFRISEGGVIGALGVPLTSGRSIAVDYTLFPRGSLAFIQTMLPVFDEKGAYRGKRPVSRFVFCQDVGAAIKGTGRVDLFFGDSAAADSSANAMKSNGALYILLKKK